MIQSKLCVTNDPFRPMNRVIPPLCLLMTVFLLVAGFALLAREKPQPSIRLHEATAAGDEERRDLLEAELEQQRLKRTVLIAAVFSLAIVTATTAFVAIRPSRQSVDGTT